MDEQYLDLPSRSHRTKNKENDGPHGPTRDHMFRTGLHLWLYPQSTTSAARQMSQSSMRSRFSAIWDTLPEDAKRDLFEDHMLPLLGSVDQTRLLNVAESARSRFRDMPRLDLSAKKAEVDTLLDELKRDAARGSSNSRRDEIYEHIVDSLVLWLSDIWQVVFEYGTDFELAHECLLFASKTLLKVSTTGPSCKCGFMNMYVHFAIKDRHGRIIKHFSYSGAPFIEDAFLWVWRDMLLKILADGNKRVVAIVPRILNDIQSKDWSLLDRLLVATGKITFLNLFDEEVIFEEEEEDGDDILCPNHASHWSDELLAQLPTLRNKIAHSLFDTFKLTPSQPLYATIVGLAPTLHIQLLEQLRAAMTHSGAAAAAALDIHTTNKDVGAILAVLTVAQSVLRPRDASVMQASVSLIARTSSQVPAALTIVARELRDCVEIMHGHIAGGGAFGGVDLEDTRTQLDEVLRSRHNSHQRQERVEHWVDAVVTALPPAGNPLTFAAWVMGFPPGFEPEDAEEPDPFLFGGIKEGDSEHESLREDWRPCLKERFEGWVRVAESITPGGQELLGRITLTVSESMPYTRGTDIVDEMISRIQEKPTQYHVCGALEALSRFMKVQRKKVIAEKNKAGKRKKGLNSGKNSGASKRSRSTDLNGAGPSMFIDPYMDDSMPGLEALD